MWSTFEYGGYDTTVGDVTGDGLPDVLRRFGSSRVLLEGTTGDEWYICHELAPDSQCTDAAVGDVNGDGIVDLVLANSKYPNPMQPDQEIGAVWAIEGGTGLELWRSFGSAATPNLGNQLELVDLDADGKVDVLTFGWYSHRTALSGLDGQLLWTALESDPRTWATVGDITQDGVVDFLIGQERRWDALIDGATGAEVWRTQRGFQESLWQAEILSYDVTADGIPDLFVGEPTARKRDKGWISVRDGATGQLIWKHRGRDREDAIGGGLELTDLTGDGFPELLTGNFPYGGQDEANLYAYDARTGQQLWRKAWYSSSNLGYPLVRADLNGDQVPDFIHSSVSRVDDQSTLVAFDARTGLAIWSPSKLYIDATITDLDLVDANSDGVSDLVVGVTHKKEGEEYSRIEVVDGRNGRAIWSTPEDTFHANYSFEVVSFPRPGTSAAVAAIRFAYYSIDDEHQLIAFDASNGSQIWSSAWPVDADDAGYYGQLRRVDWNHDGQIELAWTPDSQQFSYSYRIRVWDPYAIDQEKWGTSAVQIHSNQQWSDPVADFNGDGWLDVSFAGEFRNDFGHNVDGFYVIDGAQGTFTSGLQLEHTIVSASMGGANQLEIDAGVWRAGYAYQVLFSENGQGMTNYAGLDLPLAAGNWLTRTIIGAYPSGVFSEPEGILDEKGRATVSIDVPANALLGWVGRSLAFATITVHPSSSDPEWSTGYAELEVVQ